MKSVIILLDGTTQIALTPETDWERSVLEQVRKHDGPLTVLSGNVYECMGNYWRVQQGDGYSSLILRLDAPITNMVTT